MVIKPPRQLLGRGVFEIYDYVFVVSELLIGNVLPGLMSETFVFDLSAGVYACFIEARKHCCGGHSVKTIVVIKTRSFLYHFTAQLFFGVLLKLLFRLPL